MDPSSSSSSSSPLTTAANGSESKSKIASLKKTFENSSGPPQVPGFLVQKSQSYRIRSQIPSPTGSASSDDVGLHRPSSSMSPRTKQLTMSSIPVSAMDQAKENLSPKSLANACCSVADLKLQVIAESQEARASVFEDEFLRKYKNLTVVSDLVAPLNSQQSDCFIVPCESSIGPSYPSWGLAKDIVNVIGGDLDSKTQKYISKTYFGYVPPGTSFLIRASENMYCVFVILGSFQEHPVQKEYIYNAFRSAFLEIRKHNSKFLLKQLDSSHKLIKSVAFPVFPSITKNISIHESVWQISNALQSFITPIVNPNEAPSAMAKIQASILRPLHLSPEQKKGRFKDLVMCDFIQKRGLYAVDEAKWLLDWIGETENPDLQLKSAAALSEFLKEDRIRYPTDISRSKICELILSGDDRCYLKNFFTMAEAGKINIGREIQYSEVQESIVIGNGATAVVKKAIYQGQTVAYKEFHEGIDMREFYREVSLMSLLSNSCLIGIIGSGIRDKKQPFILLELADNGSLYNVLFPENEKDRTEITPDRILSWAIDVAAGMKYLHQMGIIHRDLKSLNLLLTEDWHCKITDYGASRIYEKNSNMTGNVGTAAWMAPELFESNSYTEKADVYSFGICLYELVCRQHPFADTPSFSIPVLVTKGARPNLPKDTSKNWAKLMQKCWHEKPTKRPSFDAILKQLENWKKGRME